MRKSKKAAVEKTTVIEKVPEKTNILSSNDLLAIETLSRDVENAKLRMALEEQYLANLLLEQKNLEHRIKGQKEFLVRKSGEYENTSTKYRNFKSELWPRYGVGQSEGLGYNPETGEIVISPKS